MTEKKKLLILYDWFYPGYKAGGPIQSITNLALALIPDYDVYIITGLYDLNANVPYQGVIADKWNEVYMPGSNYAMHIYYASKKSLDKSAIQNLISDISPDSIYLNGIFSYRFFLLPLMALRNISSSTKIIVCPRGMLKKGALAGKSVKKKIYLKYLQFLKLLHSVVWHATSEEEANDVQIHFSKNKGIVIAPNIPKTPYTHISFLHKQAGKLNLVYLSLINSHKNLLLLLQLIKDADANVSLDIYGPVIDETYWNECNILVKQMPDKVNYKGDVQPVNVQQVLAQYHALILLTKGENFGHALYESLSVGRPVITSHFTPWQNLYKERAGVNVDVGNAKECLEKIHEFAQMKQESFNVFCKGAHTLSANYYKNLDAEKQYRELF